MRKDLEFLDIVKEYSELDAVNYEYFNQRFNHRTIILNTGIDENILETVVMPLKEFEKDISDEPVTLILNTPGGSVADGLMICSIIDSFSKKLNIIVPAYACSMGTIILCSGNKNPNVTKKCFPFAFALFHSGEEYLSGESHSVRDRQNFNEEIDKKIKNYVIKNTNIPEELYDSHYRDQWYLNAEQMVEYGLINEIIGGDA